MHFGACTVGLSRALCNTAQKRHQTHTPHKFSGPTPQTTTTINTLRHNIATTSTATDSAKEGRGRPSTESRQHRFFLSCLFLSLSFCAAPQQVSTREHTGEHTRLARAPSTCPGKDTGRGCVSSQWHTWIHDTPRYTMATRQDTHQQSATFGGKQQHDQPTNQPQQPTINNLILTQPQPSSAAARSLRPCDRRFNSGVCWL